MLNMTLYPVTLPAVYCRPFALFKAVQSDFEGFQINGVDEAKGKSS